MQEIIVSHISFNNSGAFAGRTELTQNEFLIVNDILDWLRNTNYGKLEVTKHLKDVNITKAETRRIESGL